MLEVQCGQSTCEIPSAVEMLVSLAFNFHINIYF